MTQRVVVIGGGLAGAAAAYGLARRGHTVTLVEREPRPGMHASGRNAGMIRRVVADPNIAALARRGADLLANPPADLSPTPLLRQTGSILLAGPTQGPSLKKAAELAASNGTGTRLETVPARNSVGAGFTPLRSNCRQARPNGQLPDSPLSQLPDSPLSQLPDSPLGQHSLLGLTPPPNSVAALTPRDGVADPHAVLTALLDAAKRLGAKIRLGTPARILTASNRVTGVLLVPRSQANPDRHAPGDAPVTPPGDTLPADAVINAAGPWAAELATAAGAFPLPLISYRRHLLYTGPLPNVDPNAPWIWDEENNFYLRPESSGLLLCACDTDPRPPEDTQPNQARAQDQVATKIARLAPTLADLPIARCWAGLRTFAPDDSFLIGPDPHLQGLHHLTALGGHGLTTSLALADLIADSVDATPNELLAPFNPARFTPTVAASPVGAGFTPLRSNCRQARTPRQNADSPLTS